MFIFLNGISPDAWTQFWGTIITVPLTALVTILVVLYQAKSGNKKLQKQLKADKDNAIASEIYLEKYKAINKSINQIVDIRKELFDLQDNIFKLKENYYLKDTILNLRHIKHKFILMNDLFKYMEISEELGKYYNYILKYIDRIIDLLSIRDGERFNESAKESVKNFLTMIIFPIVLHLIYQKKSRITLHCQNNTKTNLMIY